MLYLRNLCKNEVVVLGIDCTLLLMCFTATVVLDSLYNFVWNTIYFKVALMVHVCDPSTWKTERGRRNTGSLLAFSCKDLNFKRQKQISEHIFVDIVGCYFYL